MTNIKDEIVKVTDTLVRFKSTMDEPEEIIRCSEYIEEYFKDSKVFVKRFHKGKTPSLLISLKDTKTPRIILSSHFDVIPAEENMFMPRISENKMYGRGVIDDKGPVAITMVLLKELSKLKKTHDVAILVTGDEEHGGQEGVKYLIEEEGICSEFAVVLDGGNFNKYVTKAKGLAQIKLTATGRSFHGSKPWKGHNAIEMLMEVYEKLKPHFKTKINKRWDKTMNLGMLQGGDAINKVPGKAEMFLDIRYTEKYDPNEILNLVRNTAQEIGDINVELTNSTPVFTTDEDSPFLSNILEASKKVLKKKPIMTVDYGGSDARFFAARGVPCVLTTPEGGNTHSSKEYLNLDSVEPFYNILKTFVVENC